MNFNTKIATNNFFDIENVLLLQKKLLLTKKNKKMAYVISEDCIACGSCISECPVDAIAEGDIYVIDADVCTDCGTCADVCPSEAISPA